MSTDTNAHHQYVAAELIETLVPVLEARLDKNFGDTVIVHAGQIARQAGTVPQSTGAALRAISDGRDQGVNLRGISVEIYEHSQQQNRWVISR
jgi:hypothetical protein